MLIATSTWRNQCSILKSPLALVSVMIALKMESATATAYPLATPNVLIDSELREVTWTDFGQSRVLRARSRSSLIVRIKRLQIRSVFCAS